MFNVSSWTDCYLFWLGISTYCRNEVFHAILFYSRMISPRSVFSNFLNPIQTWPKYGRVETLTLTLTLTFWIRYKRDQNIHNYIPIHPHTQDITQVPMTIHTYTDDTESSTRHTFDSQQHNQNVNETKLDTFWPTDAVVGSYQFWTNFHKQGLDPRSS